MKIVIRREPCPPGEMNADFDIAIVGSTSYAVVKPAAPLATASIFGHPALKRDSEPVILAGSSGGRLYE